MLEDRLTILLIEDNPFDTRLIREMCLDCETIDLDIQCESRFASGLARLRKGGVSGVLLDLNLPDSLGIETLTRVDTEFPEIPIIVLTGQEDEAIAVEAVKQGAQDYLVKDLVGYLAFRQGLLHCFQEPSLADSTVGDNHSFSYA